MFIECSISDICPKLTGGIYNRSIDILLSYNFELILKLLILLSIGNEEFIKKIKPKGGELRIHELDKLFKKVSQQKREEANIRCIEKIGNKDKDQFVYYKITTIDKKAFTIQDFINIRYDFTINKIRKTKEKEVKKLKEIIKEFKIIKDIYEKARVASLK
ncbi:MAG: hypothetical protein PHU32_05865 [Candidatus ainarchaeum sp.]|nr:hypothetical protein [Candidatus ainarchaeum sp.]